MKDEGEGWSVKVEALATRVRIVLTAPETGVIGGGGVTIGLEVSNAELTKAGGDLCIALQNRLPIIRSFARNQLVKAGAGVTGGMQTLERILVDMGEVSAETEFSSDKVVSL